jgi:hypothetical protein
MPKFTSVCQGKCGGGPDSFGQSSRQFPASAVGPSRAPGNSRQYQKGRSRRNPCFPILIVLCLASSLSAKDPSEHGPEDVKSNDQLLSVLVHREWIFASTRNGIYRASTHDKKWVAIPVPDQTPCVGWLAKQEPASSNIYYSAPKTGALTMSSTAGKTFGLYRFDPRGENWKLVSSKHNFIEVYVRDDWSIFGLDITGFDASGQSNPYARTVRMSLDSGNHWIDIPNRDAYSGFAIWSMFPDPDHEGLICLEAGGATNGTFVLQAEDKTYRWHTEKSWDWHESHSPTASFFRQSYNTQSTLFLYRATLGNYFSYPFGSETGVNAFDIGVARSYQVKEGATAVVPVEVTFRERPECSATLLDTEHGHLAWGLNRILPDGTREIIRTGSSSRAKDSRSEVFYDGTRQFSSSTTAVRPGPENLRLHRLTNGRSYKRSLNLSEFCDFSKPGRYRVQLDYDNRQIADRDRDEWVGSFTSRVFEINVVPSGL